ncbi:MAG: tail fiber domain-containing protein [Pseudomonadota bacterium]
MKNKRTTLKTLAVTGAVTSVWSKPVVEATILPAHASTTDTGGDPGAGTTMTPTATMAPTTTPLPDISDLRLKENVTDLDVTSNGHKLYRFSYIDDPHSIEYVGVMAQDLLEYKPDAVLVGDQGYYQVNYSKLGFHMQTAESWEQKQKH